MPNFVPIDRATWKDLKYKLPNTLFQKNRARLYRLFKEKVGNEAKSFALLKGSNEVPLYSSDFTYPHY